ncbi:hypothetical protein BDN72DRAFT_893015 [Pluteus cervinus]|uniref:Uncharacterized protein n=1 Tax=Pluteus cervinus TaxID=181527 RepID=A0ACD3B9F2_9AGAR|nr:hypothetical protein BDN72DRAFT_893015 [Pluteus cervinus]
MVSPRMVNGTILLQPVSPTTFKNLQRHPQYYIQGGDLHILVGNTLFRVHSYFFDRESQVFKDLLAVPPSGGSRQGSEDSSAIVLETTREDFESFLFIFYNPQFTVYEFSLQDWTAVLDQAHRWGFQSIKDLSIRELQTLDISDVQRVSLYEQYDVKKEILVPLYSNLCIRPEALSIEEAEILGMATAVRIFQGRERINARAAKKGPPSPEDLQRFVKSMLGLCPSKKPDPDTNPESKTELSKVETNGSGKAA